MLTVSKVRAALEYSVETVGKNKDGNIVVRKGFFYTHGASAESFAHVVRLKLRAAGLKAEVVESGEVWRPFRGGANTANSSHWFAVLRDDLS